MRLIKVQPDVKIPGPPSEVTMKFTEFLVISIETYKPAGSSVRMLRQAQKIVDAIEKAGDTISLEDADYDVLKAALAFDAGGEWNPKVGRRLLAWFDAVEQAEQVKA